MKNFTYREPAMDEQLRYERMKANSNKLFTIGMKHYNKDGSYDVFNGTSWERKFDNSPLDYNAALDDLII